MKSTIRQSTYKAIYRLLNAVSPLEWDCGKLCNAACCTCGKDEELDEMSLGIYLLPGEEKVLDEEEDWLEWTSEYAKDYDFPESWTGKVHFIRCKTPPVCPREKRPLQCRFFPLEPHIMEDGTLRLVFNTVELPYSCPLIEEKMNLTQSFIQATYTVWKRLIQDPLIYDLVVQDSEDREFDNKELYFVK